MNDPLDLPDNLAERAKDLLEFAPVNLWHSHALFELKKTPSSLGLIGIACSGGADSTFLLLMFFTAFPHLRERTVVLHYNHKLRKDDSNNDESFVRLLASQLELPFNVEFPKDKNSGSDEATLRQARMNFYKKLVKKKDCKNKKLEFYTSMATCIRSCLWLYAFILYVKKKY